MQQFYINKWLIGLVLLTILLVSACTRERPATEQGFVTGGALPAGAATSIAPGEPTSIPILATATPTAVVTGTVTGPDSTATVEQAGSENTLTSIPNPVSNASGQAAVHTVRPGENLYRISLNYDVGVDEIVKLNYLTSPDVIYAGQQLKIPGLVAPGGGSGSVHIVQPGDTLGNIAGRYGVSATSLAKANKITDPNLIYVGQLLTIP